MIGYLIISKGFRAERRDDRPLVERTVKPPEERDGERERAKRKMMNKLTHRQRERGTSQRSFPKKGSPTLTKQSTNSNIYQNEPFSQSSSAQSHQNDSTRNGDNRINQKFLSLDRMNQLTRTKPCITFLTTENHSDSSYGSKDHSPKIRFGKGFSRSKKDWRD